MSNRKKIAFSKESEDSRLSELFPSGIFWDVDVSNLSIDEDKDFIIPRVLSRHMNKVEYLVYLEQLYPEELIKFYALSSTDIFGNDNIDFVAEHFGLNPLDFKKYIPNLSQYA